MTSSSCENNSPTIYTLTTSVNPIKGGAVTPSEGEFEDGENLLLVPSPNDGWVFIEWAGDVSGNSNPHSLLMDSDKKVGVNFVKRTYPLTITIEGEGTVTETIIPQKTTEYEHGTIVELTPVPTEGWEFSSWTGDVESTEGVIRVTVEEDMNLTVNYIKIIYPLIITIEGKGTVTEKIITQKTAEYEHGTVVELRPVSSDSYWWVFKKWSGDLLGDQVPELITMDSEKEVTVKFEFRGKIYRTAYSYDSNGNLTEIVIYDTDGYVGERLTYTYDSNGNLTEEARFDSYGNVWQKTTYTYDSHNNLTEKVDYNSSGDVRWRRTYTYDSNGNLSEEVVYSSDGLIGGRYIYTYDSEGNLTELVMYNSDGSVSGRITYTYDSNRNKTETVQYDRDGNITSRVTYTYDSEGNLTELVMYNSSGDVRWRRTYTYDSNGNLAEEVFYSSDGLIGGGRYIYTYDSEGNLTERVSYNSDGSVNIITLYSYDSNGNPTEVITYAYNRGKEKGSFQPLMDSFSKDYTNRTFIDETPDGWDSYINGLFKENR